tara:strand:+ start:447 stop:833 length:387 start_codon:yes stop_codon:yes gene_type:complete
MTFEDAKKIEGLEKCMTEAAWSSDSYIGYSRHVEDVLVDIEQEAGVFLIKGTYYGGRGGVERFCEVYAFKDGKRVFRGPITYRHRFDSAKDDWSKDYDRIEEMVCEGDKITAVVASDTAKDKYEMEIR